MSIQPPQYCPDWPNSWKTSYHYDLMELGNDRNTPGYFLAYQLRRRATLAAAKRAFPARGRILDIAAAQGNFTLSLAEVGYRMTWNDLREELIDYVKLKHTQGSVDFLPGNIFELGSIPPFDGILLAEIIEHVAHPDQFLQHVSKLLRPGGKIVLTTPNGAYFRNELPRFTDCNDPSQFEAVQFQPNADGHIFLLHPDELYALAQMSGLRIEHIELFTNPLTTGHCKTHLLLPYLPDWLVRSAEEFTALLPRRVQELLHVQILAVLTKPAESGAH